MRRRRTCDDPRSEDSFVVGSTVSFVLCDITGVIVDLVLDEDFTFIQYAIIAFDTGPGEPMLYQPVAWNLLLQVQGGFVVHESMAASADELPEELHANPVLYGGNLSRRSQLSIPTPQSACVH